jgi:sugar/nucleoside kinase (ribokinase family)
MKTRLMAEWRIKVRDKEGKMLKEICKDGDLILLNWKKLASAFGVPLQNNSNLTLVNQNGYAYTTSVYMFALNVFSSSAAPKIAVGSGTTPASESDYRLEAEWARSDSLSVTWNNPNPYEWIATVTATFSTTITRTLAELGIFTYLGAYMLARDVLPEPITIPAGASVTVTYTLRSRSGG